jgi:DNA-binding SARP family transcriptional activator
VSDPDGDSPWLSQQQALLAWLADDDALVDRCFEQIRRVAGPPGSEFHYAIADAWDTGSTRRLDAEILARPRAFMLLLMAGKERRRDNRLALLGAAREAARQADDLWAQVLILVARAMLEPAEREALLAEALAASVQIGQPGLTDSIVSLQQGGSGAPALGALARRFVAASARDELSASVVRVNALSRSVWRGSERVLMSKRALTLVLALAVLKRARTVVLLELLWGEEAVHSGTQALKMLVSRARAQLGDPSLIVATRGGYALRDDVVVDLEQTERLLRSLPPRDLLEDVAREGLRSGYERFKHAWPEDPDSTIPSIDSAIGATRHRVIERLAKDALDRGDVAFVHDLADELRRYDLYDEAAYELEVRAYLRSDDHASAIREYRNYSDHLMQELGVKPSFSIKDLIERSRSDRRLRSPRAAEL